MLLFEAEGCDVLVAGVRLLALCSGGSMSVLQGPIIYQYHVEVHMRYHIL